MTNEIQRKLTSLTLMTIMLAGGMTIAFPGFTPDAYAVNANLIVSAENTGSYVDGAQIVEILVIDDDLADTAFPDITVNGDAVAMKRTNDGNWYAYIADTDAVAEVDSTGIDFGTLNICAGAADGSDSDFVYCSTATQNVPDAAKGPLSIDAATNWPFIQTYPFSDTIEIQYNKAGGVQITTLSFDDNADGLSLDRSHYPLGAAVHVTIGDHRLNIDPTSSDIWSWNMSSGDKYYGSILDPADVVIADLASLGANTACADCSVSITPNRLSDTGPHVLVIVDERVDNRPLPATDGTWFTVREIGGPNTAVFSSTTLADESILAISDAEDVRRGASAIITYDGDDTDVIVEHSEATIEIQSPDDVWTSGLAIPIVIVDGDVNKNSRDSDDVVLTDPDSIIPTLVTGDPFTLGETSSDLVTWLGWSIGDSASGLTLLNRPAPADDAAQVSTYDNDKENDNLILKGFTADEDGAYTDEDGADNNAVVQKNYATVESFSERAILSFTKIVNAENDTNTAVDDSNTDLTDLTTVAGATPYENVAFLVIDIEDGYGKLLESLINEQTETGYNFLNYNVESLKADITSIDILVDEAPEPVMTINSSDGLKGQIGYINVLDSNDLASMPTNGDFLQLKLNFAEGGLTVEDGKDYPIVIDFFSFGFDNDGEASDERIANQIIRLLLEESDDDTASLEGTLEYIMINQLNIDDLETYQGLSTISDEVSFIVIEDLTGSDAPSVTYLDVDTTGAQTQVSAQEDAPSHSAVVTLNVDSLKTADTVTVTLEDLDLNTDSGLPDIYTVVTNAADPEQDADATNRGAVGSPYHEASLLSDDTTNLGRMLDITFDDQRWMTHTDENGALCTEQLVDQGGQTGLDDTNFSLIETGDATGIFVGTFALPAEFCRENAKNPESVTGLDIEVNYVDFRDQSGETTEVGDSAGVKANTGAVSLDRTVYPVPFGVEKDFDQLIDATTPAEGNTDTRSLFPIHQSGMSDDPDEGKTPRLDPGEYLPQGDLVVYVTVTDPDFDVSASGKDSIAIDSCYTNPDDRRDRECKLTEEDGHTQKVDRSPVTVSVIRGSQDITVARIGGSDLPIDEIAPDAGIFEKSVTIRYHDGPDSTLCPSTSEPGKAPNPLLNGSYDPDNPLADSDGWVTSIDPRKDYCILQGDILQVEYNDPTDASGQPNTVTDSATFDLRNGVLQSDKSVYIIGSDMILTLIEPDFDLDSSQNETYDLDLIKWSSSAATLTMGDADGAISDFDPEPLSFRETGPSTGIFQIVIEIPQELDGDSLQRGEEIDLEYTDWGPSGSDYVGDQDEDIRLTVFTSNFGATIDLDQKVYSWTDKVYITIVAPDHNFDNDLIDEIGADDGDPLRVATKGYDLDNYRLVETGFDTGIFTGEVILTGFAHDATGKGEPQRGGNGPTDGYLPTPNDGGISVSYEFSEDETVFTSSIIRWNIGDVQWLEASYPASGTGVLRVIDPDMNLNPEAVDNFDVNIASNTDASGITLTVTETNEATGIFEGTVFFTTTGGSSGHRLRVSEGDTVTADYSDGTLPLPYTTNDSVSITSTTIIGTIVPPLERAPATNLRIVNTFGNSIDIVTVDQQVQIVADLSSGQDKDQDFAYLIQIQDSDGVTVSLSWIAGALAPGQQFSPSGSWTPTDAGTYTVTVFVWESISNPTALSPSLSLDVSVN